MIHVHLKRKSGLHLSCWIEIVNPNHPDFFEVVAECKAIDSKDVIYVDEIYTKPGHRRKGYAKMIIEKLQTIKPVIPVGIQSNVEAIGFWSNLKMIDGLSNTEESPALERLLLDHCDFDFKIVG